MSHERRMPSSDGPNPSRTPIIDWNVIQDFEGVLARTSSGASIANALPEFARDHIAPLFSGVTSYAQFAESTDFYEAHMGHAVNRSRNHPKWAVDSYPQEAIRHIEDLFLDSQLYPRIFPDKAVQNDSREKKPIKIHEAAKFPHLIAERNKMSQAQYERIMGGTSEASGIVDLGLGVDVTRDKLEESAERYNSESRRENEQRDRKIYSGMDRIAQNFTASLKDVTSSVQYRERLEELRAQLRRVTEAYNDSGILYLDVVHIDNIERWERYINRMVREYYFKSLFEKAFPTQIEPQAQPRGIARLFALLRR